ncbi:DUF456 domain-containing protein [Frankia sp. AgKG'84/4]|uniref:DUF456 domain-containing protein n=1 Tax=Frankia sp. AgKG'84/4 TaxID=573490 RepID=UPI0020108BD5|nr:DUF456 domain-containing protein [Frankia sp. AgKG'84/4]MCL9797850.1 DUF456 domain-containing protein [Frankia sp. AgKG'84/4]
MALGLVGVVLPVLPGLVLVWGAGLWWVIADGGGVGRWIVLALMTALFVIGALTKYVLPARATAGRGVPWPSLVIGLVCAIIGFFVIPVVGLLIGGVLGVYVAELVRLGDGRAAWKTTWAAVVAFGVGVLVELVAGVAMAAVWAVGELVL